ncbi:hypothetical protein ECFRIK1990_1130, partial [Escherichia coli FRIK1990]
MSNFIQGDLYE